MPLYLSLIIDLAAFALVVFGVIIAGRRVEADLSVRRRLRGDGGATTRQAGAPSGLVRSQELRNPVLAWVQRTTLQDPAERTALRRDLALAGFDHTSAPAIYVVTRFCLAVGLPAVFLFINAMRVKPMTGFMLVMIALGLSVVGLIAPRGLLDNRVNARKTLLENEFPDTLDLMVVCVESGLGLEGAILRVGMETVESHPRISSEFQMVSHELRAGRTRAEALRNMADRCQSEMLSAFVALLIQTDTLGGSIAQSLRIYSSEMRQHRMLRAEEKAMRLPVLLTVPLVLFILPVIMAAVLLPPVLDAMRTFLPAMAHVGK
ncbi:MAG TPA: type II secretion system F family protein [Caulobacteraceae bacterium]|jgi:tight adherence protein C